MKKTTPPPLERPSVCLEAESLVTGDRNAMYGPPETEWEKIASIWSILTGIDIDAEEAVLLILVMKMVRQANKPKRDNLVDFCGYARIWDMIRARERHLLGTNE